MPIIGRMGHLNWMRKVPGVALGMGDHAHVVRGSGARDASADRRLFHFVRGKQGGRRGPCDWHAFISLGLRARSSVGHMHDGFWRPVRVHGYDEGAYGKLDARA